MIMEDVVKNFKPSNNQQRPAKGKWSPGTYQCRCIRCNRMFIGDKRATVCADCAYKATSLGMSEEFQQEMTEEEFNEFVKL